MNNFIDIHSHILPDVDDGVGSFEEAIKILKQYKKNNINYVIFTPHLNHPQFGYDKNKIFSNYEIIKKEAENIGLKTYLGSEIYYTPNFSDFIPIMDRFLLLEFNVSTYPTYLLNSIFNLQLDGYEIILAHVERFNWLNKNKNLMTKLRDMNIYFQANINELELSETSYYLENNMIDFLGTDNHGSKRKAIDFSKFEKYSNINEKAFEILDIKNSAV